ncbi:MAG: hypothetical protein Q7V01_09780 [Vicinamibacterales bacterium]|nr:hypothetical protein [Vicinamibacterales bacterium]
MRTERMPWTCRWSELRPANATPMWMDQWMAQWSCLIERKSETAGDLDRCADCERWETRDERAGQPQPDRDV